MQILNLFSRPGKRIRRRFPVVDKISLDNILFRSHVPLSNAPLKLSSFEPTCMHPRFNKITFHTFRHWKATTEYNRTKDILHVMEMLGHRDIKTTLIYTQLVNFEVDDYHSATAKTTEKAEQLTQAGFEYVCTTPQNVMLFRKRK